MFIVTKVLIGNNLNLSFNLLLQAFIGYSFILQLYDIYNICVAELTFMEYIIYLNQFDQYEVVFEWCQAEGQLEI